MMSVLTQAKQSRVPHLILLLCRVVILEQVKSILSIVLFLSFHNTSEAWKRFREEAWWTSSTQERGQRKGTNLASWSEGNGVVPLVFIYLFIFLVFWQRTR